MDTIISKLDVMSLLGMETLNFRQTLVLVFFFVSWAAVIAACIAGVAYVAQSIVIRHNERRWAVQEREALTQKEPVKEGDDG